VLMVCDDLKGIPEFGMPQGYSMRLYQPGDEEHWWRIHLAADKLNEITPELFARSFGTDPALLAQRQWYLFDPSGAAIGTGTAWFDDNFQGAGFGRVHYLAVVPEHQGRGLGKALMTAVCRGLRELGHDRAYLTTSSLRTAAIRFYQRFGFGPLIQSEEDQEVWRRLLTTK